MMSDGHAEVFDFADMVAVVLRAGHFEGFLLVTVPEMKKPRRRAATTYVDMIFARRDAEEPGGWRHEDRADPGTESAQSELSSSVLEWYGEQFEIGWLEAPEANRIRREVFDS
jgi:hypothetical protein